MFLRIAAVRAETGERSKTTVYANINKGLFPRPVLIGQRAVGWPANEVMAVCAARIAGKTGAEIKDLVAYLHEKRLTKLDEVLDSSFNEVGPKEAPQTSRAAPLGKPQLNTGSKA